MRTKIVAGNWKMNMLQHEAISLISDIKKELKNRGPNAKNTSMIIMPPFTWIPAAVEMTSAEPAISIGAQNCYHEPNGAFTGEVSPEMIQSTGAEYAILGHSERRQYFKESHELLKKKVNAVINAELYPVFCCGEPLEVREENKQETLIKQQLKESLFHLDEQDFSKVIIAYEPVWAIGTGKTASPEQAQSMHQFIRQLIHDNYNDKLAENTTILYGGSCKPDNARELFSKPDVDGGLIGGASLKAKDFIDIFFSF
ncbi:MAG: triose-phosphate isomerase [Bacteroidales bacterium]|nr:triose-phosphate isomerase [Bacteroidales bacterium]